MEFQQKQEKIRPTLASLWIQIQNSHVDALDGRSFVPPTSLVAIFTSSAIAAAIAELSCAAEDRLGLAGAIRCGGIPTFALLVWMQQPDLVVKFRRKRCLDRLPLEEGSAQGAAGEYAPTFLRLQWEFVPFYFQSGQDVEIGCEILPFIRSLGPLTTGGFGDVEKLEIHPSLQDFVPHDSPKVVVVRKILREHPDVSSEVRLAKFLNEKRCLRLISHTPHPNIVPLLTAYIHGRELGLLFPPLDMDLKAFLSREQPHGHFQWRFTYFSALYGLSSALSRVHEVRLHDNGAEFDGIGYHHDLRPANVLVSGETFLLTDFGMGRVRERDDGSTTRFKAVRGDYSAPECLDEDYVRLDVGRAVDVWAFGCIISEVMTYAYLGIDGLKRFRNVRRVFRPSGDRDSFFYGANDDIKTEVREWLDFIASKERQPALGVPLRDLVYSILSPVNTRPKISKVRLDLAHLSMKAHFFSAFEAFSEIVDGTDMVFGEISHMRLWFERERLRAFGDVLRFAAHTVDESITGFAAQHADKCVKSLLKLFHRVSRAGPNATPKTDTSTASIQGVLNDEDVSGKEVAQLLAGDEADNECKTLQADIQRLIQELWDLLSKADSRKAERVWVHSMLDATDNTEQLGTMERNLGSQRTVLYQQGAALAMMKKIRLEILLGTGNEEELGRVEIPETDTPKLDAKLTNGHQMGVYKENSRVLIESVFYDPGWEKIPIAEMMIVMAHKAVGFNAQSRPPSLRLLDCLGFFGIGEKDSPEGFSFVYKVPNPTNGIDPAIPVDQRGAITLNKLLLLSLRPVKESRIDTHMTQPILEDKFCVASMLAGFLAEFHCTGWLHENFHSNNIIFFDVASSVTESGISPTTSSTLHNPFIIGLNKSRPGGETWHTQGPSAQTDFLDYRHPAYKNTGHFRLSYDYYSLGIMLLEIGLWTPLAAIASKREHRTLSPSKLRDMLVSRYIPRLGSKMGKKYQDVVHLLLSDGLDPEPEREIADPVGESRALSAFFEEVVDPLERLASTMRLE